MSEERRINVWRELWVFWRVIIVTLTIFVGSLVWLAFWLGWMSQLLGLP